MSTATELLRRALNCIDWHCPHVAGLREEIRAFLAAEEQYDALRERYVEGLGNSMKDCKESFEREAERVKELLAAEPEAEPVRYMVVNEQGETSFLYTRPEPSRKPMTDREIMDLAKSLGFDDITTMDFAIGFRYAEKHHGIGGDDD